MFSKKSDIHFELSSINVHEAQDLQQGITNPFYFYLIVYLFSNWIDDGIYVHKIGLSILLWHIDVERAKEIVVAETSQSYWQAIEKS